MVASSTTSKVIAQKAPKERIPSSRWRKVVAFLACQLAAILFVEGILFCAGMGEEEIFKFDPEIGFRHMTNKRLTWRTEGFAQSFLDSEGMREPGLTIAKPANTYRVALLGDSMVEGFQVPIEQTFGSLISKSLSPTAGKQVQVLNFGTSGYSTAQEYLQLKKQVLKYQPDLVLLCYNSRDIFENWSPPDQVITNVRPAAVKLPGGTLFIDTLPVRRWLKTPRAKFLQQIDWCREHSRIYGLFAAIDLEWSQKNLWYRAFINSITRPKTALKEFQQVLATEQQKGPAFQIKFFEDTGSKPVVAQNVVALETKPGRVAPSQTSFTQAVPSQTPAMHGAQQQDQHVFNSAASNESLAGGATMLASAVVAAPAQQKVMDDTSYTKLVRGTLNSLFSEMRTTCEQNGANLAVVSLPVRAELCPLPGSERAFGTIDYPQELSAVKTICRDNSIPYLNVEAAAESLRQQDRESLFYVVHLAPAGHQYLAHQIEPFVRQHLLDASKK